MPIPIVAIVAAVRAQIPGTLNDALEEARGGRARFLVDGEPNSVVGSLVQGINRAACRRYAADPEGVSDASALKYEQLCRPYLNTLSPGQGAGVEKPFSGGQCDVRYDVSGTYVSNQTNVGGCGTTRQWAVMGLPGPVSGITRSDGVQGGWRVAGNGFNFNCVDTITNGQLIDVPSCGESLGSGTVRASMPMITNVVRQDGLPDECGSPPPVVVQPRPIGDPSPPPFRFNPSPNIDIDLDVRIGPAGDIIFNIGTGDISVDPFGGGDGGGSGGGGGGTVTPTGPGEPGQPSDTGSGGESEGEAPEGKVLTGLKLNLVGSPVEPKVYLGGIYRGAAYIYMGTSEGLDQDFAGSLLVDGQFIYAEKDFFTKWKVSANLGYDWRVTPYYRNEE